MTMQAHCNGPDCNTWGDWAEWMELIGWDDQPLHFCSWNCVGAYAANMPWMEVVDISPSND